MKINRIKNDMMELWKETFHDSSRYIKLVFDTYFSIDNAFTVYEGENLIAALLGVEYEFQYLDRNNKINSLKGLYLCGLATRPEYRNRGIMAKLMNEAEISARSRGFSITFLIPADSHLREYYYKKGYETSSLRRIQTIIGPVKAEKSKMNIYTFRDFFNQGKIVFLTEMAQWCREREKANETSVTLIHSITDFVTIMSENENSFFLTESSFDPEYPILAKVRAVVFPADFDEENRRWKIVGIYLREIEDQICCPDEKFKIPLDILSAIKSLQPDIQLELCLPYAGDKRSGVEPYAMTKILEKDKMISVFENLPFKISLMLD